MSAPENIKKMTQENKLEPINTGKLDKEGQEIYNLNLKTKIDKKTGAVIQGLMVGDSITVEKIYEGGFETKFDWSIKVKYKDKNCSFFMRDKFYEEWKVTGGVGDKIRITAENYEYTFDNEKKTAIGLKFKLIE